jgi:arginyl-tRNA synthetase
MKTIINELSDIVSAAFEQCGYDGSLGHVIISNRPDLCHYQCDGSFKGAKMYKKAPLAIANEVAKLLESNTVFSEVTVAAPGFINLSLSDRAIAGYINNMNCTKNLGIPLAERPQTIVIDYGGPNIAKPLHVGHLRAAIIGEAVKRLMRLFGHRVIGDVHLGDWGLPMGLVMAELSERFPDCSCFTDNYNEGDRLPEFTADELNEIYPFANKKSKSDPDFNNKAHKYTYELQQGRPGLYALWRKIWQTSVDDLKATYEKLSVSFDLWYGESDADKYIEEAVNIIKDKGLLIKDQGAQIVDLAEEGDKAPIPPAIIFKSDGSVNYQTTDIATLLQRQKDFAPDKVWYFVDKRQELHFLQVFRTVKKAGIIPQSTELKHFPFGTMNGNDGKPFKTREGGVMPLSELLKTVTDSALVKMKESGNGTEGAQLEAAQKIGIAAIKFGDMINQMNKDYCFDLDKFLSFEGKTGTYILYTITRINSLLKKAGEPSDEAVIGCAYGEAERKLMLRAIQTADIFVAAAEETSLNYIAENAYQLAAAFSQFYHDNHILSEPDEEKRSSWLCLCKFIRSLLVLHMDVLGIETVEFM